MINFFTKFFILAILLSSCSSSSEQNYYPPYYENRNIILTAYEYLNLHERSNRLEIMHLTGIDPVRTEWCAAFVNSILHRHNIPGSESVSKYPLLAKSFLIWGEEVLIPQRGDVVVFPRGTESWQGHVGFYVGSVYINGIEYYLILGGNQNNRVSVETYASHRALSIRRNYYY